MKKILFYVFIGIAGLTGTFGVVVHAQSCTPDYYPSCGPQSKFSCGGAYSCKTTNLGNGYCQQSCQCNQFIYSGNTYSGGQIDAFTGKCIAQFAGGACQAVYDGIAGWYVDFAPYMCTDSPSAPVSTIAYNDFTVDVSPSIRSVAQGQSTTYTITVTPGAGVSQVKLALLNSCPAGATCTFVGGYASSYLASDGYTYSSPPVQQIDLSFYNSSGFLDSTPKTATLTVTTTGSTPTGTWSIDVKSSKPGMAYFGPTVSPQLAVSPAGGTNPSINVDAPANNATVSGTVSTSGWALDNTTYVETAISAVKVYLDGVFLANATYGIGHSACNVYPGRVGCPNVGWSYNWNSTGVTNGTHTLRFDAIDSDATPHVVSASRTVTLANGPTVSLTANPSSGTGSVSPRLTWATTNATSCSASASPANASWTGAKSNTSSAQQLSGLTMTTTFTINCSNGFGNATANTTVSVSPAPPTVTVAANPSSGPAPLTSTITWSSTGSGNTCNATGGWVANNIGSSGSQSITVNSSTSVLITCTNAGGPGSASVTVTPTTNYTLTVTGSRGGRVISGDGFINCGTACSYSYPANTSVTLTAPPDSGYWKFSGWSGACTGTGSCTVTMNSSKAVTATFVPRPFDYREF